MAEASNGQGVSEGVLDEIRKDPEVAPRLHEAFQLEDLKDHPGWQYQAARFANFRKGAMLAIARRLMAGVKLDPEQIAFERGYAAGVEDVMHYPDRLERDLERAAERAYERLSERLSTEDGQEPYS